MKNPLFSWCRQWVMAHFWQHTPCQDQSSATYSPFLLFTQNRVESSRYCGHESLEMFLTKSFKMLRQNLISLYIGIWNVFPQVHRSSIFEIVWENLKSNDSYSCLSYFCGMSVNMTKSWFIQRTPYFLTAEMSHRNNVKHKQCRLTWLLLRREVENISPDKKHPEVSFRRLAVF